MEISIIIPTYQCEKFISRAIRSALDQNYDSERYEIIVINDGSTDNTDKILEGFSDVIRIVNHDSNKGLASARNTGLKLAKGQFVINLDADDYMQEDLLKIASLYLQYNSDYDAISFDYIITDEKENHIERRSGAVDYIACGIMFRKDQLIDIGLYDESFSSREEEDLRIRFLKKYIITNLKLPLYRYRRHKENLTNNEKLMQVNKLRLDNKHK